MGACLGRERKLREDVQRTTTSRLLAKATSQRSSSALPNSIEQSVPVKRSSFAQSLRNGRLQDVRQYIENRAADPLGVLKAGTLPLSTAVVLACWYGQDEELVQYLLGFEPKHPPRAALLKDFALACQMIPLQYIIVLVKYFGAGIVKNADYYCHHSNINKNSPTRYTGRVVSAMTPLHYACSRGNINVIRYLLCQGADLTRPALSNHSTPLHCLAARSWSTCVQHDGDASDNRNGNNHGDGDVVATVDWIIMAGFAHHLLLENRFGKTALEAIVWHATSMDVTRTCIIWLCCPTGGPGATVASPPMKKEENS